MRLVRPYVFRREWKDGNDIVVTALLDDAKHRGYKHVRGGPIIVWGLGSRGRFPAMLRGATTLYEPQPDGSAVLGAKGEAGISSLYVDYSGASGADALLVMAGPAAKGAKTGGKTGKGGGRSRTVSLQAGGHPFVVMTLQKGDAPEVSVDGGTVTIGGRSVRFDGEKIEIVKRGD